MVTRRAHKAANELVALYFIVGALLGFITGFAIAALTVL